MKKPPEIIIKKNPRVVLPLPYTCTVELENGTTARFTQCPTRYLAKSDQYDLNKCPGCGGSADNGIDRSLPPTPCYCTKCHKRMEKKTKRKAKIDYGNSWKL